jgi:hypothetical protein
MYCNLKLSGFNLQEVGQELGHLGSKFGRLRCREMKPWYTEGRLFAFRYLTCS